MKTEFFRLRKISSELRKLKKKLHFITFSISAKPIYRPITDISADTDTDIVSVRTLPFITQQQQATPAAVPVCVKETTTTKWPI